MTDEKWVADLQRQIIEDDDKILFEEAAACFLSGYLRASYILTWISIIESLKRKIKLFSNLGDARATDAFQKVEKAEDKKQSVDKLIFEEASACGIIDNSNHSKINFLWEQRCLFAHPYNLKPEPDEVKHILGQAVRITLGKELFYNKVFLTELANNIANKPFFLPSELDRVRNHAKRTIARVNVELHPFFFKTLLSKVGEIGLKEDKSSELRKLRYFLIELFVNTSLALDHNDWALEYRVTNFPYECLIGFVYQETWPKLPDRIKEMLIAYVEDETDNQKLINLKSIIGYMVHNDALEDGYQNRFYKKLDNLSFGSAIDFYGSTEAKYIRIWKDLGSYQYDKQNSVIDFLKTDKAAKLIKGLDHEKQYKLGQILKASALNGHWKSQNFVSRVSYGSYNMPDNLKAGISYGSFIRMNNKLFIDEKQIEQAVKILNEVSEEIQNSVYKSISDFIEQNEPDEWDRLNELNFNNLINTDIENITDWDENNKIKFQKLIEKIKSYYA